MKKIIAGVCSLVFIMLFITQCSQGPVSPASSGQTQSVKVAIAVPEGLDSLYEAYVEVTASGMQTIRQSLYFGEGSLGGEVENIPCGSKRVFSVYVNSPYGECILTGSATADITPFEIAYVTIILRKPSGTAAINGWVEDETAGDTISAVGDPQVSSYAVTDSGVNVQFSGTVSTSAYGHEVIYSFDAGLLGENVVCAHAFSDTPDAELTFTKDGTYYILITVSCKEHPDVVAQSNVVLFDIKEGKVTGK